MIGRGNRLFPPLLAGSLLIHLVLYGQLAELYSKESLSVIEMSVEQTVRKPPGREIPRPRLRPEHTPLPRELVRQPTTPRAIEAARPPEVAKTEVSLPETVMAKIDSPKALNAPALAGTASISSPGEKAGTFGSAKDYYSMVRLKIESKKNYPRQAKAMQREGWVKVSFVIEPGGTIRNLAVCESSGNGQLDRAGLLAVRRSSPFPVPPRDFFNGVIPIELTIVFELI